MLHLRALWAIFQEHEVEIKWVAGGQACGKHKITVCESASTYWFPLNASGKIMLTPAF